MKAKTEKQVLNQTYMSAEDLKVIIPTMGVNARNKFITDIRNQMKNMNYFLPPGKPHLALTKLIKEKLGIE